MLFEVKICSIDSLLYAEVNKFSLLLFENKVFYLYEIGVKLNEVFVSDFLNLL
jgi:hypothetical protein